MKKHLFTGLRAAVAAAGIAYILWSLTWSDQTRVLADGQVLIEPGVLSTVKGANLWLLALGMLVMGPIYPIQALRWLLLLRARGLAVTYGKSFRLVMVGSFFNYCMPGTTGGDVAKAYYAAKGSGRKTDAVMSVVVDRVAGMIGLIIVGGLAGLFMFENAIVRNITTTIGLLAAALAVGAVVYFSTTLRKMLGVNWLLSKLPAGRFLQQIDDAAVAYRAHLPAVASAVGLSVLVHCCIIASVTLGGKALGIGHHPAFLVAVIPVLLLVAAIPITYQGLGVMEGVGKPLLVAAGLCTANQMIGMLMLFRLYMVAYSMLGSLFLLRGDIHLHPQKQETHPL